ncbi:MAG: aromatic ring-hydroxylating dioxygenase subunit alpha [Rhodospirillaceae bacterium]|nr:aromatic ring-hydroxylating dioxygenase subunit alpha [Rhodospirillaceae bacterium]
MSFLENAWYLAAWQDELKNGELFHRTILNEPVVLYRREKGSVAAIGGRCPHRFAPLYEGKLKGDIVECPYHGLQFDSSGACIHNPHGNGFIPKTAKIRSYPVVEKHRAIWIWMGDPDAAHESGVPDYSFMTTTPDTAIITGYLPTAANYELLVDNIMDLSHADYLHAGSLGTGGEIGRTKPEIRVSGNDVCCSWWLANAPASPALAMCLPDPSAPADSWLEVTWSPPGNMKLRVGTTPAGKPREYGIDSNSLHIMTPESETATHYFFANTRDFRVDDEAFTNQIREIITTAFRDEDKPMIEAQQRSMGTTDMWSLNPVILSVDAGPVRVRRMLEKLIEAENKPQVRDT